MGPAASLAGRDLGMDFELRDGWRMYHGRVVPGFPQHPHRGFETVTIARRGYIDHSDSLGATARFGRGDVQWLTTGRGIVHCEMFPLVDPSQPNPMELFQIWLNLPKQDKLAEPRFAMLWREDIPCVVSRDGQGRETEVMVVAGALGEQRPPAPPPNSWAARADADVAIWCIRMARGARWTLPAAARAGSVRALYFFAGASLSIDGERIEPNHAAAVASDRDAELEAGPTECELLLLQGRPIGEPVVRQGPFVMNSPGEIREAIEAYRRTGFGRWPWPSDDPVHPREAARFARHADGRVEERSR
jgi:hypothetical protein